MKLKVMKNKVKILLESILKESEQDKPKIKLVPLWPNREQQRLKQYEKILSQEVIEGDLDLSEAPIENLGNIKHVKGDLSLGSCRKLTHLPEGLQVNGYLYLDCCTGLKELPKGLQVGSFLSISDCEALISLPNDLKVSGFIWATDCEQSVIDQARKMFGTRKVLSHYERGKK